MGQHGRIITCNITMQLPSLKAYVVKPFQAFSYKVKNAIGTSNMYIYRWTSYLCLYKEGRKENKFLDRHFNIYDEFQIVIFRRAFFFIRIILLKKRLHTKSTKQPKQLHKKKKIMFNKKDSINTWMESLVVNPHAWDQSNKVPTNEAKTWSPSCALQILKHTSTTLPPNNQNQT